jgi:threonine/homoserine/homoserine lactone efflux protein
MFEYLILAAMGLGISFLGALPLGTLNMTALQIALREGNRSAWQFAAGVALVEILYVRLSLTGIQWVTAHAEWFDRLQWLAVAVFLVLGVWHLLQSFRAPIAPKATLTIEQRPRFIWGMMLSAVNPAQIPFWFLWSTGLSAEGWLKQTEWHYFCYLLGIAGGTVLALGLFIVGGKKLAQRMGLQQRTLQRLVGLVFIATALWLGWKLQRTGFQQLLTDQAVAHFFLEKFNRG